MVNVATLIKLDVGASAVMTISLSYLNIYESLIRGSSGPSGVGFKHMECELLEFV
jgi:hypothetical protein